MNVSLVNGDVDGDNEVTTADLDVVLANLGQVGDSAGVTRPEWVLPYLGDLGSLTIHVDLQDYTPAFDTPVEVDIELNEYTYHNNADNLVTRILPPSGDTVYKMYQEDLVPGDYTIAVKGSQYLRQLLPVTVPAGGSVTLNFSLVNGDLDGDNEVTTTDLSVVLANLGQVGD